jgi:hypothetical protein
MENSKTNSANSANQPADTAKTSETPRTRAKPRRKIDPDVISAIARLCAKSLTESEACRQIGIEPRHWFDWKSRASRSDKFAALLEEFRAGRIEALIAKIENAADGVNMKQPDWRAAAHLLAIADAKRFSDSGMRNAVQVNVNVAAPVIDTNSPEIREILDRAYADAKPAVEIAAAVESKQIADTATKP